MSNKTRKKPTLEEHFEVAEAVRKAEASLIDLFRLGRFFYSTEIGRLISIENHLGVIKNRMDETLFQDHPGLARKWTALYYGDSEQAARLFDETDEYKV